MCQQGLRNRDANFRSNCGFIGATAVVIDVGRVVYSEEIKKGESMKKEILRITPRFRRYLLESYSELLPGFDQAVAKIIQPED
jgi:hypothetical protein